MLPAPATAWPARIAALVPVFNHARTVGTVVAELRAAGAPLVVAVDDGSGDGSGQAAAAAGALLVVHPLNRGKGEALRTGFAALVEHGYTQVVTVDADGQHPVDEALRLARAADGDPLAIHIGMRDMRHAPFASRFGRWWSNLWTAVAGGAWPGDSQSGLRVYPLPATLRLPVAAGRYAYEIEVLVRAAWAGLRLRALAVAVRYPEDRVSHFRKLRDTLRAARTFARLLGRRLLPLPHLRLVPRPGLREVLRHGLEPRRAAAAAALGALAATAPIPGLQTGAALGAGWALRLNLPVVFAVSNLSVGPLLVLWGGVCAAVGGWILSGFSSDPAAAFLHLHGTLRDQGLAAAGGSLLIDWAVGWLAVGPLLAAVLGVSAWAIARACRD